MAHEARTAGGEPRRWGPGAAEHDPGAVGAAGGADAQALGPAVADVLVEAAGAFGDVHRPLRHEGHGRHLGSEGQGTAGHAGDEGGGGEVPRPQQRADRGTRERAGVGGQDAAEDGAAPAGRGDAVEGRGQVRGGDAHPERGARDGAGRGADDDCGFAGVPARLAVERRQDARLVGLADDAAGPEHEADVARTAPPERPPDDPHHAPFLPTVALVYRDSTSRSTPSGHFRVASASLSSGRTALQRGAPAPGRAGEGLWNYQPNGG